MTCTAHFLARLVLAATAVLAGTSSPRGGAVSPDAISPPDEIAVLPEVRLRKLHLVRPDLILYPMAVEVVC